MQEIVWCIQPTGLTHDLRTLIPSLSLNFFFSGAMEISLLRGACSEPMQRSFGMWRALWPRSLVDVRKMDQHPSQVARTSLSRCSHTVAYWCCKRKADCCVYCQKSMKSF